MCLCVSVCGPVTESFGAMFHLLSFSPTAVEFGREISKQRSPGGFMKK